MHACVCSPLGKSTITLCLLFTISGDQKIQDDTIRHFTVKLLFQQQKNEYCKQKRGQIYLHTKCLLIVLCVCAQCAQCAFMSFSWIVCTPWKWSRPRLLWFICGIEYVRFVVYDLLLKRSEREIVCVYIKPATFIQHRYSFYEKMP